MDSPFKVRFTVFNGGLFRWRAIFKHGKASAFTDLTGFKAALTVRSNEAPHDPILTLDTDNGGVVLGGVNGTISVFAPTKPAPYHWPDGLYELELASPCGKVIQRSIEIESEFATN